MATVRRDLWIPVAAVVLVLVGMGWFNLMAARQGRATRRAIADCHARGPGFYYWQERKHCVRYVDGR